MPSYAELITKRLEAAPRRLIHLPVYLDRDAIDALDQARAELAAIRDAVAAERVIKSSRVGDAEARVQEREEAVRATTVFAVLQALSHWDEEAVRAEHDPAAESGKYIQARMARAFLRWETLDGEPIADLTAEHWAQIIAVTPAGELTAWSASLNRAAHAPDFPTLPRR